MNLIFLEPHEVCKIGGGLMWVVSVSDRRAIHILQVLRIDVGSCLKLALINGDKYIGTRLERQSNDELSFLLRPAPSETNYPSTKLIMAVPRPKVLGRLWPVLSQLGLSEITLCSAAKVEKEYYGTHVMSPDHYRPLLVKGLEQSTSSTSLPAVDIERRSIITLASREMSEGELDRTLRIVAHPYADHLIGSIVSSHGSRIDRVVIAIGPEGGWTEEELSSMSRAGFTAGSLGPQVLTSEIALVSVISVVSHAVLLHNQSLGPGVSLD